jgi:hypothetical protein
MFKLEEDWRRGCHLYVDTAIFSPAGDAPELP